MNPMYYDPYVRMSQRRHWLPEIGSSDKKKSSLHPRRHHRSTHRHPVGTASSQKQPHQAKAVPKKLNKEVLDTFLFRWSGMHTYVLVRVLDTTIAILPVRSRLAFLYFHHAPFPRQPSALLLQEQQHQQRQQHQQQQKQNRTVKKANVDENEKNGRKKQQQPNIVISPTSPPSQSSTSTPLILTRTSTQTSLLTSQHYPGRKIQKMIKKWRHSLIEDDDNEEERLGNETYLNSSKEEINEAVPMDKERKSEDSPAKHSDHSKGNRKKMTKKKLNINDDSGIQTDDLSDAACTSDNDNTLATSTSTTGSDQEESHPLCDPSAPFTIAMEEDIAISPSSSSYPSPSLSRSSSITLALHSKSSAGNDQHELSHHHSQHHHHHKQKQQRKIDLSDVLAHERKNTLEKGWIHAPCTVYSKSDSVDDSSDILVILKTKHKTLILKARSTKEKRMFINLVKLKQQKILSDRQQLQENEKNSKNYVDSLDDSDSISTESSILSPIATITLDSLSNHADIPVTDLINHFHTYTQTTLASIDTYLNQINTSKQQVEQYSRQLLELDVSLDTVMDSTFNVHFSPSKRMLDYVNHQLADSITQYHHIQQRMMELQERVSVHDRFLSGARQRYEQIVRKMLRRKSSTNIAFWLLVAAALIAFLALIFARMH
ncbi:hypothetical protein BDF20DRAFT_849216 [Mycotypha africana]|uniref:uncharacterized protein n=1 Tax=Mycotypha africana TaxID=64632 RepID=UPI002301AFB4|nr:uncharacterized protein BDF20DRAFT_849216 [Mycotypha africana]KAI8987291.1 hypothetical protein BDF20DRAFT_849216 [Mycotypha africana]